MLTYQSRHDSPEDREKRRQWLEVWRNLPPLTLEKEAAKNNYSFLIAKHVVQAHPIITL